MIHLSKSDFLTEFSLLGKIIHFKKHSGNLHTNLQTNFLDSKNISDQVLGFVGRVGGGMDQC